MNLKTILSLNFFAIVDPLTDYSLHVKSSSEKHFYLSEYTEHF